VFFLEISVVFSTFQNLLNLKDNIIMVLIRDSVKLGRCITMAKKIVIYTEEKIQELLNESGPFHSDNFEIVYNSCSYEKLIDKMIELKADIVMFQLKTPIYHAQNFFADLAEANISPLLFAFETISDNEITYFTTTYQDLDLLERLKNFFTTALEKDYNCYFSYIGENSRANSIMSSRLKKLEKIEYMNDILRGVTKQEFLFYKKQASLQLNDRGFFLCLWNLAEIEYVDHDLNKNIYYYVGEKLCEECQTVLDSYNGGEVFYITPTHLCLIINDIPSNSEATRIQKQRELMKKLNAVLNCKTAFRYRSSFIKTIEDIRLAYESYHRLKIYNFFCSEAEFLTPELIETSRKKVDHIKIDDYLNQIKELIDHNITDPRLELLLEELFLNMIKPSCSYNIYYYCHTTISAALLERFGNLYKNRLIENNSPQELVYSSIEQKYTNLIESIHLLRGEISNRYMIKNPLVLQAIDFIHDHYTEDITINMIAEHLKLNLSYFSQIFTKEMGIAPRKYLITYRIQKAKELIESSNELVSNIGINVGFFEVKHFSKTFKKITGLTPMQYKKQYAKGEYV
jgi:two-component system, response regulator YesN